MFFFFSMASFDLICALGWVGIYVSFQQWKDCLLLLDQHLTKSITRMLAPYIKKIAKSNETSQNWSFFHSFSRKLRKTAFFWQNLCLIFFLMNGQSWVWSTSILNCLTCGGVGSQRGNFFLWLDLCENYPPLSRQCELWYVSSFPMLSSLFWCEYISGKMNKCLLNICRLDWFPTSVQKGCCEFNLCQGSHPLPCTLQMKMFNETFYQF